MTDRGDVRFSTWKLILMPAVVTLAVTLLRLYGELQHWPRPWFNRAAGGGAAIIGISWLPFIFGPYFAVKLARLDGRRGSGLKTISLAFLGVVLAMGGAFLAFSPPSSLVKFAGGLLAMAIGVLLQFSSWPSLAKTLLAYAYSARIPVAIVMGLAIREKWGTHYDVVPPQYAGPTSFWGVYTFIGLIPQLLFWIAFTVSIGALAGGIAAAVSRRQSPEILSAAPKTEG